MALDGIFGVTVEVLGKSLDLRVKRQELISANIANVETPGYRPSDLSFESELKNALKKGTVNATTNPRHIPLKHQGALLASVTGTVVETPSGTPSADGNSVEMETEMGRMAENQIMYNATVQLLTKQFENLKVAIKGS